MRPPPLAEVGPQGRLEQNTGGGDCEHCVPMVQAIDAPVPQTLGEVIDVLDKQLQAIIEKLPHVQVSLWCCVSAQPMDVEQVLDVPVLHMNPVDYMLCRLIGQLHQTAQEIPEVLVPLLVPPHALAPSLVAPQEQVIVQSIPSLQVPVSVVSNNLWTPRCRSLVFNSAWLALPRLFLQVPG